MLTICVVLFQPVKFFFTFVFNCNSPSFLFSPPTSQVGTGALTKLDDGLSWLAMPFSVSPL